MDSAPLTLAGMVNEPKSERIQMLMEPSLRRAIREWRFANQVETEGEAIRRLLQIGLEAEAQRKSS